jgi:PAS domain S-box-containing protein
LDQQTESLFGVKEGGLLRRVPAASTAESRQEQRQRIDHLLALVVARTNNAVVITDCQGRVEWVNEGFTRITGYTLAEVVGRKPGELLQGPGTDQEAARSMRERILRGQGFQVELLNYHKSGRPYWISIDAQPLYDEHGRLTRFMAIESDITERKVTEERLRQSEEELKRHRDHLEELVHSRTERLLHATRELEERQAQLVQSEKLASLGQMAAGIAHEINNPVAYVLSNLSTLGQYVSLFTQLLWLYAELEEVAAHCPSTAGLLERIRRTREQGELEYVLGDVSELLQDSLEGALRVKEIVQSLRTFARQESGEPQLVDVNKGLETTLKMVWNELKYKCEVHCDYGQVPSVMGYPTQLNQVFMNLLLNASQAIETRGEIRISTALEGREVVVRVADTGHGMSPETLSKLFTPFFTTKPPGKGTGLGLSISYGIITRHNGRIEVQSEPGRGSTFTLRLPATPE